MSTLIIAKNTTSAGTDNIMQTSVTILRAFTMCGTISPFYCCDNSFIRSFVNVYCPNTMCLGIFFSQKISQSIEGSDYQCPQFKSTCRVRNIPCEEQINSFFFEVWASDLHLRTDAKINSRFYWRFPLSNKSKREMSISIFEENYPLITMKHTPTCAQKVKKKHYIFGIIVSTSYWLLQLINKSTAASFYELSICRQARWLSRSPTMLLSFLQTLDHIELHWLWKKIVQRMTIGSQETSLAAWSLFSSQRQDFLNNNWAWIPITANQEGTRDEGHEIKSVSLLINVKKFFEDANRQFVYPPI